MYRLVCQRMPQLVLLLVLVSGCSKGKPVGDVQGKVTLNGQPLAEGAVRFISVNGDTPTTGGLIRDGAFRVEVPVAKQRVEISSNSVDKEKTPPNATADQIVMKSLPPRYNSQSDVTLDVVPGVNEVEYKLTNP
jgi:hypothetical protein